MVNILVLGANGLLGSTLCPYLEGMGHVVYRQSRKKGVEISADPRDSTVLEKILREYEVECVINLVALTSIELCEKNVNLAYEVNVGVVESLTFAIRALPRDSQPHLINLSSDHVYSGAGFQDEEKVAPLNVYALTKYMSECVAKTVGATILRTNFIGRSSCLGRESLTDWLVSSLRTGKEVTVYEDVLISALHVMTLCSAIESVIQNQKIGVYNLGSKGGNSKAYLAFGLVKRLGLNERLLTVGFLQKMENFVQRPLDMRMDSSCFESAFNYNLPTFESQIDVVAKEYIYE